jgi:hypothetical protein
MKYARQIQEHMDRLDQSLLRLRDMIKRGDNQNAIRYMEEGDLKERYEELQDIINMSKRGTTDDNLGASGVSNINAF